MPKLINNQIKIEDLRNQSGGKRRIITFMEAKHGDLFIAIRTADILQPLNYNLLTPSMSNSVLEYRYSIHPSPNSTTGVNTITKRVRMIDPQANRRTVDVTTSIKSNRAFFPLLCRLCPKLWPGQFAVKRETASDIDLGKYDSTRFSPIVMLLVGNREASFLAKAPDIEVHQQICGNFKLLLLSSFLYYPSPEFGLYMEFESLTDSPEPKAPPTDETYFRLFRETRQQLVREVAIAVEQSPPHAAQFEKSALLRTSLFTRRPRDSDLAKAVSGKVEILKGSRSL